MEARRCIQEDPVFQSVMGITPQSALAMPPLNARPSIALTCSIFKVSMTGYEVLPEENHFFTHA